MTIHDEQQEQIDLAVAYAKDGAFHTAAGIFRRVADAYEIRAIECGMPKLKKKP